MDGGVYEESDRVTSEVRQTRHTPRGLAFLPGTDCATWLAHSPGGCDAAKRVTQN